MNNKNNPINSYNMLSRLPDIRPVHSLIIIFNLALIIGGLVCEIIFYGTENFAGRTLSQRPGSLHPVQKDRSDPFGNKRTMPAQNDRTSDRS